MMNQTQVNPNMQPNLDGTKAQAILNRSVDLSVLRSFEETQQDGEDDLVIELIDLYLQESTRLATVMLEGITNKDWPAVKRAAHSLRGSSGNLGILQVAFISEELERLEMSDVFPVAQDLLQSMDNELARVRIVLLAERERRVYENTHR